MKMPATRFTQCEFCNAGFLTTQSVVEEQECRDCERKRHEREERKKRRCPECGKVGDPNCNMTDFDWRAEVERVTGYPPMDPAIIARLTGQPLPTKPKETAMNIKEMLEDNGKYMRKEDLDDETVVTIVGLSALTSSV